MNDIFKDMQANVGCEYISDLPSYGRDLDMGGYFIETSRGMCEIPY